MSRRCTVLVVDDDLGIRKMVDLALTAAGYDVRITDGRGAIDAEGVDVAVLDVRLGHRTARDLLEAHPVLRSVPIVLMTASATSRSAEAAIPVAHRIISKPFDLDMLEAAIADAAAAGARNGTGVESSGT